MSPNPHEKNSTDMITIAESRMFSKELDKLSVPLNYTSRFIKYIDSKNEWLLVSASFMAKFGLAFVLTLKNAFS